MQTQKWGNEQKPVCCSVFALAMHYLSSIKKKWQGFYMTFHVIGFIDL